MNLIQYSLLTGDTDAFNLWLAKKRQRAKKQKRDVFKLFNFSDCKYDFYFRFGKEDIMRLYRCFKFPAYLRTKKGDRFSSLEGLHILLRRLAYPNRLGELSPMFNRRIDELGRIFNTMIGFIVEHFGYLITTLQLYWLTEPYLVYFASAIQNKGAPLPDCWGFIDGTVRAICRPTRKQRVVFNGHKRVHAVKFQSVVCPNGLIANLFGPVAGSRHDCYLLSRSGFLEASDNLRKQNGGHFYVYGDPAYPLRPQLYCGFKRSRLLTAQQSEFNSRMSSMRQCVEWEFGKIIQQFAFLDYKKNLKLYLQPVGLYYQAAAILTNCHTCLYGSQTSQYFCVNPPTLEQYLSNNELV